MFLKYCGYSNSITKRTQTESEINLKVFKGNASTIVQFLSFSPGVSSKWFAILTFLKLVRIFSWRLQRASNFIMIHDAKIVQSKWNEANCQWLQLCSWIPMKSCLEGVKRNSNLNGNIESAVFRQRRFIRLLIKGRNRWKSVSLTWISWKSAKWKILLLLHKHKVIQRKLCQNSRGNLLSSHSILHQHERDWLRKPLIYQTLKWF